MKQEEAIQKLQNAINTELWAVTFYNDCITKVSGDKARKVFAKMSLASAMHAVLLMGEMEKLELLKKPSVPVPIEEEIRLATKGLDEEKEMKLNYSEISNSAIDKNIKVLAKKLFAQETTHEEMLSKLISQLQKHKTNKSK